MDATKLAEAIFSLLQAALWPGLILIIFISLRKPLRELLQDPRISNISLKAGATGFEATIQKEQRITTAALLGASSATAENRKGRELNDAQIKQLIYIVDETSAFSLAKQLEGTSVLWIDEEPNRSSYLRRALEAVGIVVTTKDPHQLLSRERNFDVIIYVLREGQLRRQEVLNKFELEAIKKEYDGASVIIYDQIAPESSRPNLSQGDRERIVKERGIDFVTTPLELFNKIIRAIVGKKDERTAESKGQRSR